MSKGIVNTLVAPVVIYESSTVLEAIQALVALIVDREKRLLELFSRCDFANMAAATPGAAARGAHSSHAGRNSNNGDE